MALKLNFSGAFAYESKDINDPFTRTVNFPNCYVQVASVNGGKATIKLLVNFYEDGTKSKFLMRKTYDFVPSMEHKNFIAQGYEYLKTLPEFEGAEDC